MKKFFFAILTSVFFLLVSARTAEAIGCTPKIFKQSVNGAGAIIFGEITEIGTSFNSDVGFVYVAYPLDPGESANSFNVHYCWVADAGATSCGSNSMGTTWVSGGIATRNISGQDHLFVRFSPFDNQENTSWNILPWRNGGFGTYGTPIQGCQETVLTSTQQTVPYSCNNPGISYSLSGTNVNIGVSVDGTNMDPSKNYRAMIKGTGAFDLGGGWSVPLNVDGGSYTGGASFGDNGNSIPNGTYTVVIADTGDNLCTYLNDNFDIRNCAVFPNCTAEIEINSSDPTKQVDWVDRTNTIGDATGNRRPPVDTITSFSLCRQIPVLSAAEINAQVGSVSDPTKAAALRETLTSRAERQRVDKSRCCQCTFGTRFYDRSTGACQGELGTAGATDPTLVRQRRSFKPGIYTAIGCIGADSESIITRLVRIGLGISGGVALLMILAGAFIFSTSQGDPKKAGEAKELITSAVIGLIFIIFSVTLLQFIGVTVLRIPGFGTAGL